MMMNDDELNLNITATHFWSGLSYRDALIDGEIATNIISQLTFSFQET